MFVGILKTNRLDGAKSFIMSNRSELGSPYANRDRRILEDEPYPPTYGLGAVSNALSPSNRFSRRKKLGGGKGGESAKKRIRPQSSRSTLDARSTLGARQDERRGGGRWE